MYKEALPFDHIRSTFSGIIDCIENNFLNFFPKKIEVDEIPNYSYSNKSYRGKYFGFYHHDLKNAVVINDFKRRIERFNNLLQNKYETICFIRTISTNDYNDELHLADSFIKSMNVKNPSLNFLLIFIIPGQDESKYFKKLNERTFIFTLNDNSKNNNNLVNEYKPIYDVLKATDLFKCCPNDNIINIKNNNNRFVEVDGIPIVRIDN